MNCKTPTGVGRLCDHKPAAHDTPDGHCLVFGCNCERFTAPAPPGGDLMNEWPDWVRSRPHQPPGCPDPTPQYVPPQQLTPGGPVHGGFVVVEDGYLADNIAREELADTYLGDDHGKITNSPDAMNTSESSYVQAGQPWQEEMEGESKTVQKWADEAMFTATPIDAEEGPKVYLLSMTPDPLGAIAAACKGYEGQFVHDLSEITDEERVRYFEQVQKTHLRAPFEFVQFHFLIEGVTRGFTHQMVRQRTATYVQESTRFAVKEDMPVALPPHLAGTEYYSDPGVMMGTETYQRLSEVQRQRIQWDAAVEDVGLAYRRMVDAGMPAEDARGLLPTNLLTRIQYRTDLKSLIEHGGNRLCTQAQFEWRLVFTRIVEAIRAYESTYARTSVLHGEAMRQDMDGYWQVAKIADVFRPICYLTGKCEFKADFDRKCSIRERVDQFAAHGVPSSKWESGGEKLYGDGGRTQPISPAEWLLDPGAAR